MSTEFGSDPNLRSYARLVRRRKWWVTGFAVAGLGASIAAASLQPNQYTASAQILVQSTAQAGALGSIQQAVTPTQVQTMLLLVASAPVQQAVRHRIGSAPPVTATEVAQTNVIAVSATSTDPARAALIANTYGRAFVRNQQKVALNSLTAAEARLKTQIRSVSAEIKPLRSQNQSQAASQLTALVNQQAVLKEQLAQMQVNGTAATGGMALVTPAAAPTAPSSPKPAQDAVLGLLVGLILGLAAAFLRDNMDDALSSKEETEHIVGAPVLAVVPMVNSWKKRSKPLLVSITSPSSPAAEAYRSLRTSLQFAGQERELRMILVTSPSAAEGKTSTLANLGAVFAQAGHRVVLVSCDLRRPRLGQFYGIDESAGLTTVMLGQAALADVVQPVPGQQNLWMLPAGPLPHNPAELLNGHRAQEVFATLREHFDLVLIDSPPVVPVTDAVILSKDADATLLIVAAGQTARGHLKRAAEKLRQVGAPLVGIVLNETTRQAARSYGNAYGYGYGSYSSYPMDERATATAVPEQATADATAEPAAAATGPADPGWAASQASTPARPARQPGQHASNFRRARP
ncbi:MAG: polysaccharide biosynthesis tyrosine autokinase [Actinomycetota bacterium]